MKQLALIGATASGKTALALKLASEFNGVILSLDSLCVYKEIDVASAKPTPEELNLVPHFGVNLLFANEHFDVGMFFNVYKDAAKFAQQNNRPLFITGGGGFYLKSLMSGLSPKFERFDAGLENGEIYEIILKNDPQFAIKFSQNDTYRLNRWLEIFIHILRLNGAFGELEKTDTNLSQLILSLKPEQFQPASEFLKLNTHEPIISNLAIFEIEWERDELRERIRNRTQNMLENGLIKEAKFLFKKYPSEPKPLKSIGLKECGEFLRDRIDENELFGLIFTHTSQLAKRQRTFNRSQFKDKFSGSIDECEAKIREFLG